MVLHLVSHKVRRTAVAARASGLNKLALMLDMMANALDEGWWESSAELDRLCKEAEKEIAACAERFDSKK